MSDRLGLCTSTDKAVMKVLIDYCTLESLLDVMVEHTSVSEVLEDLAIVIDNFAEDDDNQNWKRIAQELERFSREDGEVGI